MQYNDEFFMRRCFELAKNGEGRVAPNPMVGAVIVCNGQIIGEGYHTCYGASHAEVMAINSVTDKSLLSKSTIYVNLEPCCHYGKTPPCTHLILKAEIPKVVVAATDPFPKVNGGGIELLQNKGIDVKVGILEEEARELNRFFYTYHLKKRPYIILKWAESIDGYIDTNWDVNSTPVKITGKTSNAIVHKWRAQVQAIMVGTNTVLRDNPKLTARNWQGNNPVRVIVDRNNRTPSGSSIFNNEAQTFVFTSQKSGKVYGDWVHEFEVNSDENIEKVILDTLYKNNIQSLFIEGGTKLITNFLEKDLWDEVRIFIGNIHLQNGISAPIKPDIHPSASSIIGDDKLLVYRKNNL